MNKANWSVEQAIKERVENEDWYDWARKPVAKITYDYRPQKLVLTETAKHVFGRSGAFIQVNHCMTKEKWIEKEIAEQEKKVRLDARNKSTLRAMKGREFDELEKQAVRIDNHNSHDDY